MYHYNSGIAFDLSFDLCNSRGSSTGQTKGHNHAHTSQGKTDPIGVAKLIVKKLGRGKLHKSTNKLRRKLHYGKENRPSGIGKDLHSFLKEMSTAWRTAFRDKDRGAAARLLQVK